MHNDTVILSVAGVCMLVACILFAMDTMSRPLGALKVGALGLFFMALSFLVAYVPKL